jgi:uncharacterized protein
MTGDRRCFLPALIVTAAAAILGAATPPATLSPAEQKAALLDIEKDRAETQAWLKSDPQSYLATVDRLDFERRTSLTVGRASDNDVRIDDPSVSAHHVRVTVEGERFHVVAVDPVAHFSSSNLPHREAVVPPSTVGVGRYLIRLSHQNYPGLIVFDPKSPRFSSYKGLSYFPADLNYRYEVPLIPNPKREVVTIQSTRGNTRQAQRVGWVELLVDGTPVRLECMRLLEPGVGDDLLEVFFRDATSGRDTYPLGRYLEVKRQPNGRYLVDFNLAYNPACAYSDHYNCPVPPKTNTVAIRIPAGERDSHYH